MSRIYRTKYPRKQQIQPRIIGEAFGYEELIQTVRELKAMKAEFQKSYDIKLKEAEKRLDEYVKNTRKGDRGIQGPKGEKGDTIVGPQGPKGEKGEQGVPGRDGKSPNEETVVRKVLNKITLPKAPALKEIVSAVMDALKDKLETEFDKMRREIRQISSKAMLAGSSGGGMGTPVKFSFTGDGSTTEFTLPAEPSGEGLAIWPHDQSAWLQPGVHFNVSGKIFTTTYIPEDGVVIEGILIP